MSFYEITKSTGNKDLDNISRLKGRYRALKLYGDFESTLTQPEFYQCPERPDLHILDFSKGSAGLKAFGAEQLISQSGVKVFGYAAPRFGHASEAIAMLAERYKKKAVFFAPASSQVTKHQAVVLAYRGCELRFARIAAMPALNSWIRNWADKFGALALPFGLSGSAYVTAGLVKMCDDHMNKYSEPKHFWCAVSTGTMIRALQIGWPKSRAYGIAVARNIKDGEIGVAHVESYHKHFYKPADIIPAIDTTMTYDAKAYEVFIKEAKKGSVFINVGSDKQIETRIAKVKNWDKIHAAREWGDQSAFGKL